MVAHSGEFHAFPHQAAKFKLHAIPRRMLVARRACFQHLLHSSEQSVRIEQHQVVKFAALRLVHFAALQRLEVKANGGDGRLEFMSHCVDKAVVLLIQLDFTHQETCIQDQSENNRCKEENAEKEEHALAPVENDPSDVQRDGQRDQARWSHSGDVRFQTRGQALERQVRRRRMSELGGKKLLSGNEICLRSGCRNCDVLGTLLF